MWKQNGLLDILGCQIICRCCSFGCPSIDKQIWLCFVWRFYSSDVGSDAMSYCSSYVSKKVITCIFRESRSTCFCYSTLKMQKVRVYKQSKAVPVLNYALRLEDVWGLWMYRPQVFFICTLAGDEWSPSPLSSLNTGDNHSNTRQYG
jgi:hypothetical protein